MILILGDVHLGAGKNLAKNTIGQHLHSRVFDQVKLLDWTLERAIDNFCSDIIITGDIFEDPKPESALIQIFIEWLKKCQICNKKVHIITGNHDILRSGNIYHSPLDIISEIELENVFIYKNLDTILIGKSGVTLMPFKDRKSLFELSNANAVLKLKDSLVYEHSTIPANYYKVVIGHFAIEGSIYVGGEVDDISNELFCPVSMFNGYDFVWICHVHSPQVLNKSKPYVSHVGSMDISDFGETEHEKHIILYEPNSGTFSSERLPTRSLKKIKIEIPEDCQDNTEYILEEIKKNNYDNSIIKIEIESKSISNKPVNKVKLEEALKDRGAHLVSAISETKKQTPLTNKKIENHTQITSDLSIQTAIKTYADNCIDEKIKDIFIEKSLEILNTFNGSK